MYSVQITEQEVQDIRKISFSSFNNQINSAVIVEGKRDSLKP